MTNDIKISRDLLEDFLNYRDNGGWYDGVWVTHIDKLRALLAAPVVERQEPVAEVFMVDPFVLTTGNLHLLRKGDKLYTSPPAPVAADIAHDRAYRNGLMAGFQFGISGNENGYAVAIANFNSEIHAAKGEAPAPAPVAVVLDESVEFEKWWRHTPILRKGKLQIAQEAWQARACLDKVKELNQ